MRLEYNEYVIIEDEITISRKALEKLRDHYLKVADGCKKEPFKWGFYIGKADVLTDLLKHFEKEG